MSSLRDRVLTRAGARSITGPVPILAAGAGASAAILAGVPLALAAAAGAGLWAAGVALGLARLRSAGDGALRMDPRRLSQPWQGFVLEALDAEVRYRRAIDNARAGAIQERLVEIGHRVEDGVLECYRIALQGHDLDQALRQLEPAERLRERLELLHRSGTRGKANAAVAESLRNQLRSTERIAAVAEDACERLEVLDARLDEAVARAVELSLRAGDVGELGGLEGDVDDLVADMEALRQALDDTSEAAEPGA